MTSHSQSLLHHHPVKGILLASVAWFLFACMDSCTKYLTTHYDVPVVVAMRYLVAPEKQFKIHQYKFHRTNIHITRE